MNLKHSKINVLRVSVAFLSFWPQTSFTEEAKDSAQAPLELSCTIHKNGKALNCYYGEGKARKLLNDQDLITFINQANKGAYVTVKSRRGYERVFFVDPNGVEFKNFYKIQATPNVSMREVGQAKYAVYGAIENKVIQIANALDTGSATTLVTTDPAYAYLKFKTQLMTIKQERDQLKAINDKYQNADTEKHLEAALQEKQYYSHYLSLLLKTLGEPGSCAEEFQLKPNPDGSVNLDHLNELATLFQQKCRKEKKEGKTEATALYEKYSKDLNAPANCNKTYDQGPFVVSGNGANDRPFCFGVTLCEKEKGKPEKTTVSCAASVSHGHYSCPAADHCGQERDVFVFNKEVHVE